MKNLELNHPDKLLWPRARYSKRQLADYLQAVAPVLLTTLKQRPLALKRYPQGTSHPGFFQKDVTDWPDWLPTEQIAVETTGETLRELVGVNQASLTYLVNMDTIELHMWLSKLPELRQPDLLVLDFDPAPNRRFREVVDVALAAHALLDSWKFTHFVKTSGKRGLHLVVPIKPEHRFARVHEVSRALAERLCAEMPALTSAASTPGARSGKIFIDYLRNSYAQTMVAPYSPRPTPEATVSAPVTWDEVDHRLDSRDFTIKTMPGRLSKLGDLWAPVRRSRGISLDALAKRVAEPKPLPPEPEPEPEVATEAAATRPPRY